MYLSHMHNIYRIFLGKTAQGLYDDRDPEKSMRVANIMAGQTGNYTSFCSKLIRQKATTKWMH
jgi:hypothetical protein